MLVGLVVGTAAGLGGRASRSVGGVVPDPRDGALQALAVGLAGRPRPRRRRRARQRAAGRRTRRCGPRPSAPSSARWSLLAGGLAALALVRPTADPRAPLPVAALVGLTLAAGLLGALLWSPVVAALGRSGPRGPAHRSAASRCSPRRRPLLPSVTAGLPRRRAGHGVPGRRLVGLDRSGPPRTRPPHLVPLDARVSPSTQVQLPATVVDAAAADRASGPAWWSRR